MVIKMITKLKHNRDAWFYRSGKYQKAGWKSIGLVFVI